MELLSSAFAAEAPIPRRFTCDGENLSPPLRWSDAPEETRSYVLLCDDPDAPSGTWHHWAVYDIPPNQTGLVDSAAQKTRLKQATNDFRKVGYGRPCPPPGHGIHHYHFRLLALSTDHLRVQANASCRDVEREAQIHPCGSYSRWPVSEIVPREAPMKPANLARDFAPRGQLDCPSNA